MTEDTYLRKLGEKIMARREELNLTQVEFAAKVKITRVHLYRIEYGKTHTTITVLRKIAMVLEMPLGQLVEIN